MKEEKIAQVKGIATSYSKLLKSYSLHYVKENNRTFTPISNNLNAIVETFEVEVLKNIMKAFHHYCIWDIEINVDTMKLHVVEVEVKNDNEKFEIGTVKRMSFDLTLINHNKTWLLFLQSFNKEYPNGKERFKIDSTLFISELSVMYDKARKLIKRMSDLDKKEKALELSKNKEK